MYTQIHTQGIEGIWRWAKSHLETAGGSLEGNIQERLDEYIFHRTYLRDKPLNVWIMLRLLGKYGNKAKKFVDNDINLDKLDEKQKKARIHYRAEYIASDEDIEYDNENEKKQMKEFLRWTVDIPDGGDVMDADLVRLDEDGDIETVEYANPANPANIEETETEIPAWNMAELDPMWLQRMQENVAMQTW